MITIAYDEHGQFEQGQNADKFDPLFIAGIIYDNDGAADDGAERKQERKRIVRYLKKICAETGAEYPTDLHLNHDKTNGKNHEAVKKKVGSTLGPFLKEGKLPGQVEPLGREGCYKVFAFLKSEGGKEAFLSNRITKDSFAGNLYQHMAEEAVSRIAFHEPDVIKSKTVFIEFPTRSLPVSRIYGTKKGEFLRAKISTFIPEGGSQELYSLANADIFRTFLDREIIDRPDKDTQYDFRVNSISYKEDADRMEFLYLSDLLCSLLAPSSAQSSSVCMNAIRTRAEKFAGKGNAFCYFYDEQDIYYDRALKAMERNEYFEALKWAYEGISKDNSFARYYKKHCYPKVFDMIAGSYARHRDDYRTALTKLVSSTLRDEINQNELKFIFDEMFEGRPDENAASIHPKDGQVLFELYSTGVAAYNHVGDSATALKYYKKCEKYAQYVSVDEWLAAVNRGTVIMDDLLKHKDAEKAAKKNVRNQKKLAILKRSLYGRKYNDPALGKAYSQYGQTLAFQRKKAAEAVFQKALSFMENDSGNRAITLSYLLHFYVDQEDLRKYEQYVEGYLNSRDPKEQLSHLIAVARNGGFVNYALYLYSKALWVFYADRVDDEMLGLLQTIETMISDRDRHPWELIYKYYALIFAAKDKTEEAETYLKKAKARDAGSIIRAIEQAGRLKYAQFTGNWNGMDTLSGSLWTALSSTDGISVLKGKPCPEDPEERTKVLLSLFTYAYN